jgi:transcriptional regulator with XRE-family HTH domain
MRGSARIGVLIRRARRDRGLSQQQLAEKAGISQAVVSYYESGRLAPSTNAADKLAQALGLPADVLKDTNLQAQVSQPEVAESDPEHSRRAFLSTLDLLPGRHATLDQPAGKDGGDLAFAVDLRSHVFLVVIDAQGSGVAVAPVARLAAACAFGAIVLPGGGLPSPADVVDATVRLWRHLDASVSSAAICVICFDRQARRVRQCRLAMPVPFIGGAAWTGKPDGPAGAFLGERAIAEGGLLLIATDGVANLPTKGERTLWNAPELRTMTSKATDPSDVIGMLTRRAKAPADNQRYDDRFAIAVMPW